MKLFVVLAIVGFVAAAPERHVNFCRGNPGARSSAESVRAVISTFLPAIIGHCPTAAAAIEAGTFFSNDCAVAFDQGFCYVAGKVEEFGLEEKIAECASGDDEEYTVTTTYRDMAEALASGGDVYKLGHLACSHGFPCLEHLVKQIAECAANDADFWSVAVDNAVALLSPIVEENSGAMADFVACKMGADSDAMTIFSLVQDKVTSFDDIVSLLDSYLGAEDYATLARDAKMSLYAFLEGAKDFCDAGCVRHTGKYFKQLFKATHDDETCPMIGEYCGGCQDNADSFIVSGKVAIPCCTQDALDSIYESIVELTSATYVARAGMAEEDIIAAVEAAGISTDAYFQVKAAAEAQIECLSETYDALSDSTCA